MKTVLAASALMFLAGAGFAGECVGENLIAALPGEDRAWIRDRAEAVPYHQGILWRAEKGDAWISIVGTYHFDHAMHPDTVARLQPDLAAADRLLVEMGPEEEAQLQAAMLSDPTLIMDPTGPTLPERLSEPQWQEVSAAMEARGVPAVMASRMRPWYLAMLMGFSPCAMQQLTQESALLNGLDKRLMAEAETIGLPVEALEPWDTVIQMFGNLTPQEEVDMIVYSLPMAGYADDYTTTMDDAYAAGDIWQIWEFGRLDGYRNSGLTEGEVDEMLAEAEQILMHDRNRAWIDPMTGAANMAAASGKGVVAAFGALHLPGEKGVLRLLEQEGWTIERVE